MIGPKPSEAVDPLVRDDGWRKDAPEREWDIGKIKRKVSATIKPYQVM